MGNTRNREREHKNSRPLAAFQLHKDTTFNLYTVNSPGLATVLRHQVAGSACCALSVGVVGISNIHDDFSVDVLVRGVGATGGSLAFSCSSPALGDAGVCGRRQMCFEGLRDATDYLPDESLETTLPSRDTVWSYFLVESLYLSTSIFVR